MYITMMISLRSDGVVFANLQLRTTFLTAKQLFEVCCVTAAHSRHT